MPYRGPSTPTLVSRVWQLAADLLGEGLAELETPLAHNLTAHLDAAGRQHLFHHAQAQRKAEVEPHGVADDLCGKAVAGVGGLGTGCHAGHLPVPACPAKPRLKLTVPRWERPPRIQPLRNYASQTGRGLVAGSSFFQKIINGLESDFLSFLLLELL